MAKEYRLLRIVATYRHAETCAAGPRGTQGWMPTARATLIKHGLAAAWASTQVAARTDRELWKEKVYTAVETTSDWARRESMRSQPSTRLYRSIKDWDRTTKQYAFSSGEVGRLGRRTPERYLDDRRALKATRLKLLCRLNCLELMERMGRQAHPPWPRNARTCPMCNQGEVEDVTHFITACPAYVHHRNRLYTQVTRVLTRRNLEPPFDHLSPRAQTKLLLGKRLGHARTEDRIDALTKEFLKKAWNIRAPMAARIRAHMSPKCNPH